MNINDHPEGWYNCYVRDSETKLRSLAVCYKSEDNGWHGADGYAVHILEVVAPTEQPRGTHK